MASNTPNKCATINDLPNELLISIFEYLEIAHLIQCSLVCKHFKLLCKEVKVQELLINGYTVKYKTHWCFTNKQLNYQNAISVAAFNLCRSTFRLDKFRRLYFDGNASEYAQLKLNEFTQLEQVAINIFGPDDVRQEFHINLSNLKMIEIYSCVHKHKFFITTPKLEMLKYDEFDSIDLTYVDNIKHLETGFHHESCHILNDEEIPLIKHIRDLKLTTLSCNRGAHLLELDAIEKLMEDKRELQRSLPKIYLQSVEMDDFKKIDEYKNHRDDFQFQINNYNSLAETVSMETPLRNNGINYNQLMTTMKGKIPDDFFKKFSSTRQVCVNGKVENPEHLYWFLKSFTYLQELNLESDILEQSFYSQLGELDQLQYLIVEDSSVPISKLTFNFGFILKLKFLREFTTNFKSPNIFDLALELFRPSKYMAEMHFYFEEKKVNIYKSMTPNVYHLFYDSCRKFDLDIDGLAREVDAITSRNNDED